MISFILIYYYHQISEVDLDGAVGKSRSQSDLSQTNYPAPSGRKITLGQLTGKVNNNASKVIDENGEPLVVYHGTPARFNEFKANSYDENYKNTFWFTADTEQSSYHARGGNIVEAYLNIKNPQIGGDTNILNTSKHDGYIDYKAKWDGDKFVPLLPLQVETAFATMPNQIKSATENNGDFSLSNNNIKFSRSTPSNTPADNSAMRSFFAPAKGKQALGWLAGVFQRNHLIDFVAQDLPELINYS